MKPPYDKLQIRRLQPSELKDTLALCETYHWPLNILSLEHASEAGFFFGAFSSEGDSHHFEKEGNVTAPRLLGTINLIPQGSRWAIGYVLVDPAHHRNGIGTWLMRYGIQFCRDQASLPKPTSVWLSATSFGAPVYQRMGFQTHRETLQLLTATSTKVLQALFELKQSFSSSDGASIHIFNPVEDPGKWSKGISLANRCSDADLSGCLNKSCLDRDNTTKGTVLAVISIDKSSSKENGFGIIRPYGTLDWNVGPIFATDESIAKELFCQLVKARSKSIPDEKSDADKVLGINAIWTPDENDGWFDWLKTLGLEVAMPAAMMSFDLGHVDGRLSVDHAQDGQKLSQWAYIDPGNL